MAGVNLKVLGGFEVRIESGSSLTLPTRKTRALLAYLALSAGAGQPRDKLTALLWGDSGDRQARQSLRQALFALRRSLAPAGAGEILVEGERVALDPAAVEVDAALFERHVRAGTPETLEHAMALYRGDLLEGLLVREAGFEEWLVAERERLRELAQEALARLVALHDRRGDLDLAIRAGQRLIALDPLQEPAHRALMRLYARDGRRGAALRQYQTCLDVLQRELGTEPEAQTRELYHDLLRRRSALAPASRDAARAAPAPVPPPAAPDGSPLLGRDDELTRLTRALEQARGGRGLVAAVVGEAGVGKSRLVDALAAAALAAGVRVVRGRAHEMEGALPLGPWIDAIHLDQSLGRPTGSPDDAVRLFEAVAQLLGHLASAGPLLVVLEDLHWADETSLNVLSFIARRLAGWPVMVVVTATEEELPPPLSRLLRLLDEQGQLTMRLGRLGRSATSALVGALAPPGLRRAAQRRLGTEIWRLSEGNPFMVVEAVRAAGESRRSPAAGRRPLPERIRAVVLGRLERLDEPAQRLVGAAAIVGRECEFTLLSRVVGLGERPAAEAVEQLVRRGLLRASGELLEFTHASLRRVAEERLLEPTRRGLHRAAAEALEAAHADGLERVHDRLAHHYARSGDAVKAVRYLVLSAEAASQRYAIGGAVRTLEAALEHARRLPAAARDRGVLDVSLRLAEALSNAGKFGDILKLLQPQRERVERLDDPGLSGVYHFRVALSLSLVGHHDEARGSAGLALDEATRSGDTATLARAHYVLAVEGFSLGQALEGVEHGRQAVRLLEPLDDRRWLSLAHWVLGLNHLVLGELDAARRAEEQAEALGRAIRDRALESFAAGSLAWIEVTREDWPAARAAAQRAVELAPELAARATAQGLLAYTELASGEARGAAATRALRALVHAVEQVAPFGIRQSLLLVCLAETHLRQRRLDRAESVATRLRVRATEIGFTWGLACAQRALGRVAAARGKRDEARRWLDEARATFGAIPARFEIARTRAEP
jgi:DNA-binding SARP family transcriptional activator